MNSQRISRLRVVAGTHKRIQLANSLNQLDMRVGNVSAVCQTLHGVSGAIGLVLVGWLYPVQEGDVGPSLDEMTEHPHRLSTGGQKPVPIHVKDLYKGACQGCTSDYAPLAMAQYFVSTRTCLAVGTMTWV